MALTLPVCHISLVWPLLSWPCSILTHLWLPVQIATCLPGTEAATLDMIQAYWYSPIIPTHKKYLAVCWCDRIYMKHNAIEGLASAGGIQGTLADTCVEILSAHGIWPVFKWVNSFVIFKSPSNMTLADSHHAYNYDLASVFRITDPLRIPWHPIFKKGQDFSLTFKYLSFLWNLPDCSVSLPEEKCLWVLLKLTNFLIKKPWACQKDYTSLQGSLNTPPLSVMTPKVPSPLYHTSSPNSQMSTSYIMFPNQSWMT